MKTQNHWQVFYGRATKTHGATYLVIRCKENTLPAMKFNCNENILVLTSRKESSKRKTPAVVGANRKRTE